MSENLNTDTGVVAAPTENFLQDPDLAQLLSRQAALLGHSVPAHRYGMMDRTADGVAMADLPRWQRAQELWVASFPSGIHHEKDIATIERGDFHSETPFTMFSSLPPVTAVPEPSRM